eukprot:gene32391-41964_t
MASPVDAIQAEADALAGQLERASVQAAQLTMKVEQAIAGFAALEQQALQMVTAAGERLGKFGGEMQQSLTRAAGRIEQFEGMAEDSANEVDAAASALADEAATLVTAYVGGVDQMTVVGGAAKDAKTATIDLLDSFVGSVEEATGALSDRLAAGEAAMGEYTEFVTATETEWRNFVQTLNDALDSAQAECDALVEQSIGVDLAAATDQFMADIEQVLTSTIQDPLAALQDEAEAAINEEMSRIAEEAVTEIKTLIRTTIQEILGSRERSEDEEKVMRELFERLRPVFEQTWSQFGVVDGIASAVARARERVAQSIAQMETTDSELQAVRAAASERMTTLKERFDDFLSHISAETARATSALDTLQDAVQSHEKWLRSEISRTTSEADDTASACGSSTAAFGDATTTLKDAEQTIGDRVTATTTLYEETRTSADQAHDAHSTSIDEAKAAIETAARDLGERESSQRDRINGEMDGPVAETRADFDSRLAKAVEAARVAFDTQGDHVQTGSSMNLNNLTGSEQDQRKTLIADLESMSQALSQLGSLVSETSNTMVQGADQATELMQMTGVGVNTVIGLIDNLREIFNEIESADYPWAGASEVGGRSRNEDSWGGVSLAGGGTFVVVADGLGGHSDGQVASRRAVKAATALARRHLGDDLEALVRAAIAAARDEVLQARIKRRSDMDSTFAALAMSKGAAAWAHCGDSRIYRISGSTVTRLTVDHSLAMSVVPAAERMTIDTRHDTRRNSLLSTLGTVNPMIDVGTGSADDGAFLLCTDGLWEALPDEALAGVDAGHPNRAAAAVLSRWRAARAPDSDNATLVVVGRSS